MFLSPGDRLPSYAGVGLDRSFHSADGQAGRAAVLLLGGPLATPSLEPLLAALTARRPAFAAGDADLLLLLDFSAVPALLERGEDATRGARLLLCRDEFFAACAVPFDRPLLVVADRAGRIAGCWPADDDPACLVKAALQVVSCLAAEETRPCTLPAPVLFIPGLLDHALCQELIGRFEDGASFDSGVSGSGPDGRPRDVVDHARKSRRDCLLTPGDGVHERVLDLIGRRCMPEIKRAFQHEVAHVDRMLIARYDEGVGHFKRHRDNASAAVAFRQFALSINLNAGAYTGGHLLFPEFNDHRYLPATGEGMVFSASLLHEAARVLTGRRYVLLTFLYDRARAAAELQKLA